MANQCFLYGVNISKQRGRGKGALPALQKSEAWVIPPIPPSLTCFVVCSSVSWFTLVWQLQDVVCSLVPSYTSGVPPALPKDTISSQANFRAAVSQSSEISQALWVGITGRMRTALSCSYN